jgi:hypothetical protein
LIFRAQGQFANFIDSILFKIQGGVGVSLT